MTRRITIALALIGVVIAATTMVDLFSEYSLDVIHVLNHSMFAAILLVCAKLLMSEADLALFDFFVLLELNVFDRFQYLLAQSAMALSGNMRKIQTGNLNFNMTAVIIGFIICLLLSF